MKVTLLPENHFFTHKITVDYTDISAAALTKSIQILPEISGSNNPVGTFVTAAGYRLETPFDGGDTATLSVQIGDDGDPNRFLVETTTELHKDATQKKNVVAAASVTTMPFAYDAANGIDALFTATEANLNELTAGSVDLFLRVGYLAEFDGN